MSLWQATITSWRPRSLTHTSIKEMSKQNRCLRHTLSIFSQFDRRPLLTMELLFVGGRWKVLSSALSWSDLQRARCAGGRLLPQSTVSSDALLGGVGDRDSDPHDELSLSSFVGRRVMRGEEFWGRRPTIWDWMCSMMRLNRRKGPEKVRK